MKKTITIIGSFSIPLFGWHIVAKTLVWVWQFQIFLGSYMFDMSEWDSEDKTMYGLAGVAFAIIVGGLFSLCLFDEEKSGIKREELK